MDERQNPADSFEFDNAIWLYRQSADATAKRDDQPQQTGFYYWEFREENGKRLLAVRKPQGEPFRGQHVLRGPGGRCDRLPTVNPMQRPFLKFAAAILGTGLVVVPFLGLDSLPRDLRRQIESRAQRAAQSAAQIAKAQDEVTHDLQAEPDLFRSIPASKQWPSALANAAADLQAASRDMEQIAALEKQNRREDRDRAAALLAHERSTRTSALTNATAVQKDADHWVELKKKLPEEMKQMERDYQALHAFDFAPVTGVVQKAQADWPDKRGDLESRLDGVRQAIASDESIWQSTAAARREASAGNVAGLDIGALLSGGREAARRCCGASAENGGAAIDGRRSSIDRGTRSWSTWRRAGSATNKSYDQKIRTVTVPKDGQAASEEKWVEVSQSQVRRDEERPRHGGRAQAAGQVRYRGGAHVAAGRASPIWRRRRSSATSTGIGTIAAGRASGSGTGNTR